MSQLCHTATARSRYILTGTATLNKNLYFPTLASPRISQASTSEVGFFMPSFFLSSAFLSQGEKALIPVWNSAQYFTSSLNLAHSAFT